MVDDIVSVCKRAADLVLSFPKTTRIRVVSHYDTDGITAAGIISSGLHRQGYDFHTTLMRNPFTKGFDRLKNEKNELIIFSDMGSAQIESIEDLGCSAIILDHHQFVKTESKKNIVQVNSNMFGVDGNYEACAASLSYTFAVALDPNNDSLIPLAVAGIMGDKQYIGGIRGFNKGIVEQAVQNKRIKPTVGIKLAGSSLAEALFYSIDPYYRGLSGNEEEIAKKLGDLGLKPSMKPEDLSEQQKKNLQSLLLLLLMKIGCPQNILKTVVRDRYTSEDFGELEQFADLLDACGKHGARSLGLALCIGDTQAIQEAKIVEKKYKQKILDALHTLEQGGIQEMNAIRFFSSDESSLGGVIGGIAVNYLCDEKKPLFSIARKEKEIHVSCRGNQKLVAQGLDLGLAMKTVAESLGGYGGGHKIAAGATIACDKEKEFLEKTDELIATQLKGKP